MFVQSLVIDLVVMIISADLIFKASLLSIMYFKNNRLVLMSTVLTADQLL
jgi:hypothetical protein